MPSLWPSYVLENLCPPLPLDTKKRKSVFDGLAAANKDATDGLLMGATGNPFTIYVL